MNQNDNNKLEKASGTLSSVRCIVKKGSETKYDNNLTNQGGSFHGEITGLEPAGDYSVLLYGISSSSEIIARGYKSKIDVSAGNTTTVEMAWSSFQPVLSAPSNGSTSNNNKPTFSWSSVSNASTYELIVDNSSGFGSPEINQTGLTSAGYTATTSLSDGTYYWKVRCKDSFGNWGAWSEVWSFTIQKDKVTTPTFGPSPGTYTTTQNITISCSTSGATIHYTTNGADPTESDPSISSGASVTISSSTTLKARAYKSGWNTSDIASGTYTITGTVATPTFSPSPGTYATAQNVTISCTTSGATIHYTTNGSDPMESDQSISSGASVTISSTTTLKARVYKSGWTSSDVAIGTYTITGSVATPTFSPSPGTYTTAQNVTISCTTSGATIHYTTNGADPTESDPAISSGVSVAISSTTTLKARAYKAGLTPSDIASGTYTITGTVSIPTFSPSPGTFTSAQNVTVSCSTSGATIHYTTNGSDPTESDLSISSGVSVAITSTTTLKARAYKAGWTPSDIASGTYTITGIIATPTFNPSPGTYTTTQNVTISCSTSGATIHYTTNGADPTESDPTISSGASITISSTTNLKARAYKTGWTPSSITSGIYTINTNTVTDIDGNTYQTVTIGGQVWMAENLKVTHYQNGDPIPNVTGDADWSNLTDGAYCNYNNDVNNVAVYGRLYNWFTVNDSRNIAPLGWHVPSDAEWQTLVDYLGGDAIAGGKMKETGTAHWNSPNTGATNESGFSALPGGYRSYGGDYRYIGDNGYFWSSTEEGSSTAWSRCPRHIDSGVVRYGSSKWDGFSVRCVRDEITETVSTPTLNPSPGTYTTAQNVTITCSTSGAIIYYTTNGSDPTETDQSISNGASVTISSTMTLKARAYKSSWNPSNVASGLYTINETVTDIDGNVYHTVTIGTQVWMVENLKVTHYRNGNMIPNVTDGEKWSTLSTGAYADYNNDANNTTIYGRLYNWHAINDNRGIAPAGWHVPSDEEWKTLEKYLGMSQAEADLSGWRGVNEGGKLKEKGYMHWISPNNGATNESGFSALPGGYRDGYSPCDFNYIGINASIWSSTSSDALGAWYRHLDYQISMVDRGGAYSRFGFSIRCVRD